MQATKRAIPTIPYTRWRHGRLYLNLPIPADLRPQFLTATGRQRTHIVETLGTGDPAEGRRLARERQAFWELEFARLRRGHRAELPSTIRKARELREAMSVVLQRGDDEAAEVIEGMAVDFAESVAAEAGIEAAKHLFEVATKPQKWTLQEAVDKLCESPDLTEGTKNKRRQQIGDLIAFLKMPDCLPEYVTEERAVAYVEYLNSSSLSYATKEGRLSALQALWKFLERKRQVPRGSSPWHNHELTRRKKGGHEEDDKDKRGWTTPEILRLFRAPDPVRAAHYNRQLFRELYTVGFCTGLRLEEIVSLRPRTVEMIPGGVLVRIEKAKTKAGIRNLPVLHPAAVAILARRREAQKDEAKSIFPECRPGGKDNKLSWHVSKAMGRDRDRLGFGPEVDFHSTRRSFMTMMENTGADVVHVQRYVGHRVPTMMHTVYSDGASFENLRKVAARVRYEDEVEVEFRKAAGLDAEAVAA
jgi:integrase